MDCTTTVMRGGPPAPGGPPSCPAQKHLCSRPAQLVDSQYDVSLCSLRLRQRIQKGTFLLCFLGCLGKHGFHRGAHCVKVGSFLRAAVQIQALRAGVSQKRRRLQSDSSRGQAGSRIGGGDFSGSVSAGSNGSSTCAATGASRARTCGVSSGTAEAGGLPDSRTQNAPISITVPPKMTLAAAAAAFSSLFLFMAPCLLLCLYTCCVLSL